MIAYKTFNQCPEGQRPSGIPLDYPWQEVICESEEQDDYEGLGYVVVAQSVFDAYKSGLTSAYNAWLATQAPTPQQVVEGIIQSAMEFGVALTRQFAAENVLLGITAENKAGDVLDKTSHVMAAIQSGSLYEAITRIRAISPSDYDSKYITAPRLLVFIQRIETYLKMPLSQSL